MRGGEARGGEDREGQGRGGGRDGGTVEWRGKRLKIGVASDQHTTTTTHTSGMESVTTRRN